MQLVFQITSYNTDPALKGQVQAHRSHYSHRQLLGHKSNVTLTAAAVKGKSTLNHLQRAKKLLLYCSAWPQTLKNVAMWLCSSPWCHIFWQLMVQHVLWYHHLEGNLLRSLSFRDANSKLKAQKIIWCGSNFNILACSLHVCHERSSFLQCSSQTWSCSWPYPQIGRQVLHWDR